MIVVHMKVTMFLLQRNNNCKGGIMEQWHQKLHNNTSPDDVVICQVSECKPGWISSVYIFKTCLTVNVLVGTNGLSQL